MLQTDRFISMPKTRGEALAEFKRILKWIALAAVLMVAGAMVFLAMTGDLTRDMVIATTLGVFFSVLLGCGLFAAAFFSDKSGHDQSVSDATSDPNRRD